ncbi:hypothetical protein Cgig2_014237 [Carnegiea gigantea]|uniref:Synaptotagmin-3 n=1 Tax=Carnegiea gigantea TaxID=171969 RepID=A0A9Q1K095_9CARY|nr:hypothetical protein Cgig2_014237 [Carnegiea gigantea]
MGFVSTFLGIVGFAIGLPIGLILGFFLFVYSKPKEVKEPIITPIHEMDTSAMLELLPEIPYWIKSPDYERAVCKMIKSTAEPIFADYIGKYQIKDIKFENLCLGTLPPTFHGMKVYETNENQLVLEPAIKWAGNPNIVLAVTLMSAKIRFQVSASPRIHLKPLVPTFPCFANIVVSLMEKPYVDFGLTVMGGDIMSIPGVYRLVQETIKKQVASLYHWPQFLEIPVLDTATAAVKKPVGILHVNVIRATKLLKMDVIGTSDPYVRLRLSGEKLPEKRTSIKMRNLNPEWNEKFKLIVKDPETQALELHVYDWDKVGEDDKIGMQLVPLKELTPNEQKKFTLDLLKNTNMNDPHNKKPRGTLEVELTFDPFKLESDSFKGLGTFSQKQVSVDRTLADELLSEAGLLSVTVVGAEDLEAVKYHTNPYAQILFRGERRKTTTVKKNRDPRWNEDFEFMVEEPPLNEKLRVEVFSKRRTFGFSKKESLGFVDIVLDDVVNNGRINEKYHLINSKNGIIQVELEWRTT